MKSPLAALNRSQTFLKIMMFTFVTVMIWVGLSLFRTQEETGISPALLKLAEPLNPNINADILTRLEQKRGFNDQDLADFPVYAVKVDKTGEEQMITLTAPPSATPAGSPVIATSPPISTQEQTSELAQ